MDFNTFDDLQRLVQNQVSEKKTIEYKKKLPEGTDEAKKEFLADVSSFANAAGGYLFYGIREEAGLPIEIPGLDILDVDKEILSLENRIRDGLAPRIPGVTIQFVQLPTQKVVIIIYIPKSWASPHMITVRTSFRFYSRNSVGKYPLDVGELRAAFVLSETTTERIRSFRQERLAQIVADETPVPMQRGAKLVLHIVPFQAFDPGIRYEVAQLDYQKPRPSFKVGGFTGRHNFDGYLTYSNSNQNVFADRYLQVFRNGTIEAVNASLLQPHRDEYLIQGIDFEKELLKSIPDFMAVQQNLGIDPPLFIMLSLLEIRGYGMGTGSGSWPPKTLIDRAALLIPEVLVESFNIDFAQVMRPIFDVVWNAAGFSGSPNYDSEGNWQDRPHGY